MVQFPPPTTDIRVDTSVLSQPSVVHVTASVIAQPLVIEDKWKAKWER